MNLRDLQYLIAVAEHLHFGTAARMCHVSQPTLSMQLKKLEDTLGVQLFERTNKKVILTPTGQAVTTHARNVLAAVEQMKDVASTARDGMGGTIRMGIFPTLAPYLLPSLMPQMRAWFATLTLQLVEEKTPDLLHQLEHGHIDCALLAMPLSHPSPFLCRPLFHEAFTLAVAADHPLAKRAFVKLSDLSSLSMLLLEEGHCLRAQALEVCALVGVGESGSFRATSLETLRHMVASSHAATLMPQLATRRHDPGLRYLPFKPPAPSRQIGLFWRPTSARTPVFEAMAQHIATAYRHIRT
jgi:LysR family hydrogen peroxide-inducible transcriptional activator